VPTRIRMGPTRIMGIGTENAPRRSPSDRA
jgi:hypothetical protein